MRRHLGLILAAIMLMTCAGCFVPGRGWVVPGDKIHGDQDRGGHHGDRDRGYYDGDRRDYRGGPEDHR